MGALEWGAAMGPALEQTQKNLFGIANLQQNQKALEESARHNRALESVRSGEMEIQQEANRRERAKFDFEEAERQKKIKWGKGLSPVLGIAQKINANPKTKEFILNLIQS